jgi:hypothetical protein
VQNDFGLKLEARNQPIVRGAGRAALAFADGKKDPPYRVARHGGLED